MGFYERRLALYFRMSGPYSDSSFTSFSIRQHSSLTYLLTPWRRVLLEKLTGLQLVKKFPTFHGTRRSITPLTSVRHLSLSWASPIQSIYPHPTSCRSILILSTHLRLGLPSSSLTIRLNSQFYILQAITTTFPLDPTYNRSNTTLVLEST